MSNIPYKNIFTKKLTENFKYYKSWEQYQKIKKVKKGSWFDCNES